MEYEKIVCDKLKIWFNEYNIDCWHNYGENQFHIQGSKKKPDMIIYSKNINQYIVIEVKPGEKSKDIYDADKVVINYWNDYTNGITKYFINDKEIKINSFTVATYSSMYGKIFQDDYELLGLNDCTDQFNIYNKKRKIEPLWEYRRTRDYLRHLWAEWRHLREKKEQPGVGIIVANILNSEEKPSNTQKSSRPVLFDMQYEQQNNKSKWQNRQKLL